jgi:hypothetical protein
MSHACNQKKKNLTHPPPAAAAAPADVAALALELGLGAALAPFSSSITVRLTGKLALIEVGTGVSMRSKGHLTRRWSQEKQCD